MLKLRNNVKIKWTYKTLKMIKYTLYVYNNAEKADHLTISQNIKFIRNIDRDIQWNGDYRELCH